MFVVSARIIVKNLGNMPTQNLGRNVQVQMAPTNGSRGIRSMNTLAREEKAMGLIISQRANGIEKLFRIV